MLPGEACLGPAAIGVVELLLGMVAGLAAPVWAVVWAMTIAGVKVGVMGSGVGSRSPTKSWTQLMAVAFTPPRPRTSAKSWLGRPTAYWAQAMSVALVPPFWSMSPGTTLMRKSKGVSAWPVPEG